MSNRNNLDELLRSKLSNHEDGFIGSDWLEFKQKLDQRKEEKRRWRKPVFWLFSSMLLIALISITYNAYYHFNSDKLSTESNRLSLSHSQFSKHSGNESDPTQFQHVGRTADNGHTSDRYNPISNPSASVRNNASTLSESANNQLGKSSDASQQLAFDSRRTGRNHSRTHSQLQVQPGVNGNFSSLAFASRKNKGRDHTNGSNQNSLSINNKIDYSASQLPVDESAPLHAVSNTNADVEFLHAKQQLATNSIVLKKAEKLQPLKTDVTGKKPLVKEPKVHLPLEVGIQVTTGASFLGASPNPSYKEGVNKNFMSIQKASQKPGYELGSNFIVKVPLFKGLNVSSGIGVSKWTVEGNYDFYITEFPIYDRPHKKILDYWPDDTVYVKASAYKEFTQTVVPLNVEYQFGFAHKLKMDVKLGGAYNMNRSVKGTSLDATFLKENDLSHLENLKNAYISCNLGVGVSLPLGRKLNLYILPEYSSSIGGLLSKESVMGWRNSSIRLTTAAMYRF